MYASLKEGKKNASDQGTKETKQKKFFFLIRSPIINQDTKKKNATFARTQGLYVHDAGFLIRIRCFCLGPDPDPVFSGSGLALKFLWIRPDPVSAPGSRITDPDPRQKKRMQKVL